MNKACTYRSSYKLNRQSSKLRKHEQFKDNQGNKWELLEEKCRWEKEKFSSSSVETEVDENQQSASAGVYLSSSEVSAADEGLALASVWKLSGEIRRWQQSTINNILMW